VITEKPDALCLMGPTASGKTALAIALHERFPIALISVDSMLIYRGLDVGTAKPDRATLERAPHALIDIRAFWEPYSAQAFVEDAEREIDRAHALGQLPVLVGGTGLYFRALTDGLSALPPVDPAIRAELKARAEAESLASLRGELDAIDPISAARIDPNDAQRTLRALEVFLSTGQRLSALHGDRQRSRFRFAKVIIEPSSRAALHAAIAERTRSMFAHGLVDEVCAWMRDARFDRSLSAARAVGYRQVIAHLDGASSRAECEAQVLFATRQYAKRQLTWLRAEVHADRSDPARAFDLIATKLERWS
jgi:tRNA dimethylallyltransferase